MSTAQHSAIMRDRLEGAPKPGPSRRNGAGAFGGGSNEALNAPGPSSRSWGAPGPSHPAANVNVKQEPVEGGKGSARRGQDADMEGLPFGMDLGTARQIATLQAKLNKRLGPEFISQRPGPAGGPKLTYMEGWKAINLANEVFGFNGWSSSVTSLNIDFMDADTEKRRYNCGVTAIVRVTLRDGSYHEDVGYGALENAKSKAAALDKCKKEAVTDGLKRALRTFGNLLGNCLYDRSFTTEIVKLKVPAPKFDRDNLHRRPEFGGPPIDPPLYSNAPADEQPPRPTSPSAPSAPARSAKPPPAGQSPPPQPAPARPPPAHVPQRAQSHVPAAASNTRERLARSEQPFAGAAHLSDGERPPVGDMFGSEDDEMFAAAMDCVEVDEGGPYEPDDGGLDLALDEASFEGPFPNGAARSILSLDPMPAHPRLQQQQQQQQQRTPAAAVYKLDQSVSRPIKRTEALARRNGLEDPIPRAVSPTSANAAHLAQAHGFQTARGIKRAAEDG